MSFFSTQKKVRTKRGSVLIFTLLVLMFLLIAALSVATITISETKTSSALSRSTVAFQIADSGMELVLERIYSGSYNSSSMNAMRPSGSTCSSGEIIGNLGSGTYRVHLIKQDGSTITDCNSTSWRADAESIQSEGTYGGTTRAVKADLDPTP